MFRFGEKGEKGVNHYNYFVRGQEPDICARNLTVWLSKIDMVYEAISGADRGFRVYAWVDAGISRVNGKRTNWDFTKLGPHEDQISHYGSNMRYLGQRLPISAGYLAARIGAWRELHKEFYKVLPCMDEATYMHDEETLLGEIHSRRPELFNCVGMPVKNKWDTLRVIRQRLRQQLLR